MQLEFHHGGVAGIPTARKVFQVAPTPPKHPARTAESEESRVKAKLMEQMVANLHRHESSLR